jgi:hypothetical protein
MSVVKPLRLVVTTAMMLVLYTTPTFGGTVCLTVYEEVDHHQRSYLKTYEQKSESVSSSQFEEQLKSLEKSRAGSESGSESESGSTSASASVSAGGYGISAEASMSYATDFSRDTGFSKSESQTFASVASSAKSESSSYENDNTKETEFSPGMLQIYRVTSKVVTIQGHTSRLNEEKIVQVVHHSKALSREQLNLMSEQYMLRVYGTKKLDHARTKCIDSRACKWIHIHSYAGAKSVQFSKMGMYRKEYRYINNRPVFQQEGRKHYMWWTGRMWVVSRHHACYHYPDKNTL